jgi:ABC-type sugar transport system substrate-binding protein
MRRAFVVAALALVLAAPFAEQSGAAHPKYTVAYLTYVNMAKGSHAAAAKLGVRIVPDPCHSCSPQAVKKLYQSMIARRVDAIVSDGYDPALVPVFKQARKAGILVISSGDDIAGKRDLWVSPADPVAYGDALADALASQLGGQGEYAILDEQGEYPIVKTWTKVVEAAVARTYPAMKLDGVVTETGAGDQFEVDAVKSFMAAHPSLRGLIGIVPTEAYMAAEAITQSGRIGQVFSAGNGGSGFSDPQLVAYVRSGAAELVYGSNPIKLGYLTVWAAHYLLSGHHFSPGAYQVGGPIGIVDYYAKHQELRLGQPLTIAKKNVEQYANTF